MAGDGEPQSAAFMARSEPFISNGRPPKHTQITTKPPSS